MNYCSKIKYLKLVILLRKQAITLKLQKLKRNRKIAKNKSKHLLVENELNKLKTFDLSYFFLGL